MTTPFDPNDFPPEEFPPPAALPGLGSLLVPRYSCNLAVNEEVKVLDLIHEVINISSRQVISQGSNGQIRIGHKKPADYALGTSAFAISDTVINVDDVSKWVADLSYYVLIDPHTDDSEIRTVTDANYPTAQNSTTLTQSAFQSDGTTVATNIFTISGFAGADGNNTPATATITVGTHTDGYIYSIILEGKSVRVTPSSSDTTETIAAFLAGAIRTHPALNRRFLVAWSPGDAFLTLTARFGTLTLNTPLTNAHVAPVADPSAGGSLTAIASGSLEAGFYRVSYTEKNEHGETLPSPYKEVTVTAGQKITVPAVTPSVVGNTICWYVSTEANDATHLRFILENSGATWTLDAPLPKKSATMPPDLNRTGTEVVRVKFIFSDRAEIRSDIDGSNVLRDTFSWLLGKAQKTINAIYMKIRDSSQDWRLYEIRLRDDPNIAKTKKTSPDPVNGQAIDSLYQGYRIASSLLAEAIDGAFLYEWTSTREACLVEEGDVVTITDDGSGVYNFPVMIESVQYDLPKASMPRVKFVARKYASTLYDDSIREISIPIVTEATTLEFA